MDEVARLVSGIAERLEPLSREVNEAYWELATTSSEVAAARYADREKALRGLLSDREAFRQLKYANTAGVQPERLFRQVRLLMLAHASEQHPPEVLADLVDRQNRIEQTFGSHRGTLAGEPRPDNDLRHILRTSRDSAECRAAWEGLKEVGAVVGSDLVELVRRRNAAARELGFVDHYRMALELQEIEIPVLLRLLDDLERRTEESFGRLRMQQDHALAKRFGIGVDDIRPWHLQDPFFQEAPAIEEVSLDQEYAAADLEAVSRSFFSSVGLPVEPILAKSDLYERAGKNQHAFCMHVDRKGLVRVLCNLRPNAQQMRTLLHELGHGVYDAFLDFDLPFILREPAHTFTTEAVAMLFGRLPEDGAWMTRALGVDASRAARLSSTARRTLRARMLVFARWVLVMTTFERAMYQDPEQDLGALWWQLVERFQRVTPPDGARPTDWASKIHLATAPVYYHNYMLGEMMASQLEEAIEARMPGARAGGLVGHWAVGTYLKSEVFRPGKSLPWGDLVKDATGSSLTSEAWLDQFVRDLDE